MENTLGINVYVSSPSIMDCPVYPVLKWGIDEYQHLENLSSS